MDGTPFGHYQLLELLGRGGMGEVYRALDTKTNRIVALKLLPPHLAEDEAFQKRFRRESQAAAAISEPHVVPIHGFGEIGGRLYLDMRLVDGLNLGAILAKRDRPLGPKLAAVVVEQVGSALDAAHEQGLVHRDVKPSNILISDREFVYLIDFGLARTTSEEGVTTAGNTLGTLAYMAPERFEGGQSDPRSDIYALTCVLYECITGVRPYSNDSLEQQIAGHMVSPPPRPSNTDSSLAAFDEVIATGMAKDPERRYQTGAALAVAVREALDAPPPAPRRGSGRHWAPRKSSVRRPAISRRALVAPGVVLLLLAVGAVGVWQLRAPPDGEIRAETPGSAASGLPVPGSASGAMAVVPSIAATVPAVVRESGRLVVGVNLPYAPNEFRDAKGNLVGFDVDLIKAVSRVLGLAPEFRETAFEKIIPLVQAGEFDLGMSSFTDTRAREQYADFVTYFEAGTLWAQRPGAPIDPANACGLRVGVAYGAIQETEEIPAKSDACIRAGHPPVDKIIYARQDDLTSALIAGNVDAMSADSPVTGFAIKNSGGALEAAGEVFDAGPYGWPVAKDSPLAESLRQALVHLIGTGEYRTIATLWGVELGTIDRPVINGAVR